MIPAYFLGTGLGTVQYGKAGYVSGRLEFIDKMHDIRTIPRSEERETVVVVDVPGLRKRTITGPIIRTRLSGRDFWLLTYVSNVDDVLDAFLGNQTKLLLPVHLMSTSSIEEAYSISDSCIPCIMLSEGKALKGDIDDIIDRVSAIGFGDIVVYDTDDTLDMEDWNILMSKYPDIIPFSSLDLGGRCITPAL